MRVSEIPFKVLRVQYRIARFPLQVIEDRAVARMGPEAPARLLYERSLGALDATVGNALGDPELEKRGAALAERSEALGRAAQLDATAAQTQQDATADLNAKRTEVAQAENQARATKQREAERARTAAEERKRAATADASKRTAAAKRRADELAASRTKEAEAFKRGQQAKIRAAEQKATAAAEAKREDARAKRDDAASKRAQADRIEKLAKVENLKRRAERAKNNA
jgi:hypothetical protein